MIPLSDSDVADFRTLFEKETRKKITHDQARAYAQNVVELVALVYRPSSLKRIQEEPP